MNDSVKILIGDLLKGNFYILPKVNHRDQPGFKVYRDNMVPQYYVSRVVIKKVRILLKKDKRGRYTLNLSKVRSLHGNNWIKKAYKNAKRKTMELG